MMLVEIVIAALVVALSVALVVARYYMLKTRDLRRQVMDLTDPLAPICIDELRWGPADAQR